MGVSLSYICLAIDPLQELIGQPFVLSLNGVEQFEAPVRRPYGGGVRPQTRWEELNTIDELGEDELLEGVRERLPEGSVREESPPARMMA